MTRSSIGRLAVAATAALVLAACGSESDSVASESDDGPVESIAAESEQTEPEQTDAPSAAPDPVAEGCPPEGGTSEAIQQFDGAPPFCLEDGAEYSAVVSTTAGDITIALDRDAAPTTVNSFVFLARNNYFDDTVCHRVIQDFVAQCGDPTATGTGGPGYSFDDELPAAGAYQIGSIAMANSGPNTNGSQFFIISGPNGAALPPLYNLFGQVSADGDLGVVAQMNAQGSLDNSGIASEELRILDVEIIQS